MISSVDLLSKTDVEKYRRVKDSQEGFVHNSLSFVIYFQTKVIELPNEWS
jgi:hypothetical protein